MISLCLLALMVQKTNDGGLVSDRVLGVVLGVAGDRLRNVGPAAACHDQPKKER